MAGRPRKAIMDIERLYRKEPLIIFSWLQGIHKDSLDLEILSFVEKWVNSLDKKEYQMLKDAVDEAIPTYLEPEKEPEKAQAPDNIINFPLVGA